MVNPVFLDIICAAVLIAAFLIGRSRGMIRMLFSLFAWAATIVIALVLAAPVGQWAARTPVAEAARASLEQRISSGIKADEISGDMLTTKNIAEAASLPLSFVSSITNDDELRRISDALANGSEQTVKAMSKAVSENAVGLLARIAGFLMLMIAVRIALAILFRLFDIASKLPGVNGTNRLLGGLFGAMIAIIIIYIILAYIAVFVAGDTGLLIGRTHIVKYFYNNNLLLLLSGR